MIVTLAALITIVGLPLALCQYRADLQQNRNEYLRATLEKIVVFAQNFAKIAKKNKKKRKIRDLSYCSEGYFSYREKFSKDNFFIRNEANEELLNKIITLQEELVKLRRGIISIQDCDNGDTLTQDEQNEINDFVRITMRKILAEDK